MTNLAMLSARLRVFLGDTRGTMSVEAALAFPMLFWIFSAMYSYWEAFKIQNNNLKASYAIADMLSRETGYIDQDYLNGLNKVFAYMTTTDYPTKMRVSVVSNKLHNDGVTEYLNLEWSNVVNGLPKATQASQLEQWIPVMAVGDQVIVVETFMVHEPIFNLDLHVSCSEAAADGAQCVEGEDFDNRGDSDGKDWTGRVLGNLVTVRPRFVPQVLWQP